MEAYGKFEINGVPDNAQWSDVLEALKVIFRTSGGGSGGLFALQIEDDILYVYYDNGPPPPLYIDFNPNSETYAQLIWEVNS